jgi:hypothetical protein
MEDNYLPYYIPGAIWHLKPRLAFGASTNPVDTSAQAALAPDPTMEKEESSDTTLMVMTCQSVHIVLLSWGDEEHCNHANFVYL